METNRFSHLPIKSNQYIRGSSYFLEKLRIIECILSRDTYSSFSALSVERYIHLSESYIKKGKRCALSLSKYTYLGIQMDENTSQMWNTLHKHITNVDPKVNFKSVGR